MTRNQQHATNGPQPTPNAGGADSPAARTVNRRAATAVRQMGDAAVRTAILRALSDTITAEHTAAREELAARLRAAHAGFRVKSIDVELPDGGGTVATATLTPSVGTVSVADPVAQLQWVGEHFPDRLVTVIDPAFARQLLTEITTDPATGNLVHVSTGQPVPWAKRQPAGPAYPTLRFTSTGRQQIITAWRNGRLAAITPEPITAEPTRADPGQCPALEPTGPHQTGPDTQAS